MFCNAFDFQEGWTTWKLKVSSSATTLKNNIFHVLCLFGSLMSSLCFCVCLTVCEIICCSLMCYTCVFSPPFFVYILPCAPARFAVYPHVLVTSLLLSSCVLDFFHFAFFPVLSEILFAAEGPLPVFFFILQPSPVFVFAFAFIEPLTQIPHCLVLILESSS